MTADRAALVENVAIVLFNAWNTGRLHDTDGTAFYLADEEDREGFRYEAQSAIELIRTETLEEAAGVADRLLRNHETMDTIPAAIRALRVTHEPGPHRTAEGRRMDHRYRLNEVAKKHGLPPLDGESTIPDYIGYALDLAMVELGILKAEEVKIRT